jgi:hypothetical protein
LLIADASKAVQNDLIIQRYYPFIIAYIEELSKKFGERVKENNDIIECLFHISLPKDFDKFTNLPGYEIALMKNRSSISYSSHEEAEFYSKVKTSLIQRVRTYIPPTNALDYVSQIIKFFAVSLKDLWRRNDTDNIRSFFQRSTRHMIDPKDILTLFLSNKDSPMVKDFCDLISEDPLHLFRGRYEITVTFFTISLRPLMPERYFCVTVIV